MAGAASVAEMSPKGQDVELVQDLKARVRRTRAFACLISVSALALAPIHPVSDLAKADIERMALKISIGATKKDEKTGRKRGRAIVKGGKLVAGGCVTTLSAMFNWAKERGLMSANAGRVSGCRPFAPTRATPR